MKTAFILNDGKPSEGSIKSFLTLLKYFSSKNTETVIITPNKKETYKLLLQSGYNVVSYPLRHNIYPTESLFKAPLKYIKYFYRRGLDLYASAKIAIRCKKEHVDIIHSNSSVLTAGFRASNWLKIPHITHIREYGDLDFSMNLPHLQHQLTSDNNYSIAITKGIATHRPSKNQKIIYNVIIEPNRILNIQKKEDFFLYAGRIEYSKGIDILIDAFIEFCKKNPDSKTMLKITGDYNTESSINLRSELLDKLSEANISDRVIWLGNRSDISDFMAHALATIIPSRFEAFGRVMPEAISNGCIVIGKNTGGTKEQFDNGLKLCGHEIGFRFDTVKELSEIMTKIVNTDFNEFTSMIHGGFHTVMQLYTNSSYYNSVIEYYNEIIKCHD